MNKILITAAATAVMASSAAFAGNPLPAPVDPAPMAEPAPASSIGSLGSGGGLLIAALVVGGLIALAGDSDSSTTP